MTEEPALTHEQEHTNTDNEQVEVENTSVSSDPLYLSSEFSAFEYHINVLKFALKHCLTKCALEDLLKLISFLLPQPNLASPTIYRQNKFLNELFDQQVIQKTKYCATCHRLLEPPDEDECPNRCANSVESFVLCDIEQQLKNILSGN